MNLPGLISAFGWLTRDTFRIASSSGLLAVMLTVTVVCSLFCLSIGFSGDTPLEDESERVEFLPRGAEVDDPERVEEQTGVFRVRGKMSIGFGAFEVEMTRDRANAVRYVQLLLCGWVADTAGILLILVWTAGFLPSFLEANSASVLLAKPTPRWALLLGKYVSVVAFVGMTAALFVGSTWLALALKSGVWDASYLWCVPILVLHFSTFFGFSVFLAVCTRSTIVCVIGSVLFWFMCCALNFGRHELFLTPELSSSASAVLIDAGYWMMPKPLDMSLLLFDAVGAEKVLPARSFDAATLTEKGLLIPELSALSSYLFACGIMLVAVLQFRKTDY